MRLAMISARLDLQKLLAEASGATDGVPQKKKTTPVRRIDGPYGDRNLMCTCPPIEVLAAAD